ncbi:RNA-directed DNA polymerase (Reverse transcriptase) [Planktothrix sp. PCC 11201]|uniref:reverse transcriptase domain-containing protein n=1 Tax=Planktothrix sp. PCC 11201 TaxID=1729650 RepID=UPI000914546B|nr:reverse transcriptase domain-containing protein [Planktothrix sp. PCC 11201]SKB13797.1 RNA-directed DNA polymerase (Reverse transcriptase) [Planktothrix sp. PCC 11201]
MMSKKVLTNFQGTQYLSSTAIIKKFLSLENFYNAWEKVAGKRGCAGIDEETLEDFSRDLRGNLSRLRDAVANCIYQPLPCKQVLIPKKKGNWRELRIPTVRDRIIQHALLNVLAPGVDCKFSRASFGYRPNLSYINAVEQVAQWRDLGYYWVLDADITQFFDNIQHERLLREVRKHIDYPGILCLIKAWISVGVMTKNGLVRAEKGVPQGAVISPLMANIYLDEFDKIIMASDIKLVRYADDFLVLAKTKEQIIHAYSIVQFTLNSMGLILNLEKTQITHFSRGFRFLGHGFVEDNIFPLESSNTENISPSFKSNRARKKTFNNPSGKKISPPFPSQY